MRLVITLTDYVPPATCYEPAAQAISITTFSSQDSDSSSASHLISHSYSEILRFIPGNLTL